MGKKKKIIFLLVFLLLIPSMAFGAGMKINALLAPHIQIVNSGKNIDVSKNQPITYNNTTYVPLRVLSEAIGYEVKWDGKNSRVDLIEPQLNTPVIEKGGVKVMDYTANPDAMITLSRVSANYSDGEIVYTITEQLSSQATATFQVLNKDKKVVTQEIIILKETKPGTHKEYFHTSHFSIPYVKSFTTAQYEEKMLSDYSYRLILN